MMTERRRAHRYDLSLPVIIRVPMEEDAASRTGKTRDISTRGVYFTIDKHLKQNAKLDLTMTLPIDLRGGTEVLIRAEGKVVRTEKLSEDGEPCFGVAATIECYELVRDEATASQNRAFAETAS